MNAAYLIVHLVLAQAGALLPAAQAEPRRAPSSETVQVHGQVSLMADVLSEQDAFEARPRVALDVTATPSHRWRLRFDGSVEGLRARRSGKTIGEARADVREAWVEGAFSGVEVRAGYGRLVWGRLDEIQPSDVINPLDTARFLLEGRSEARRAVAFVRTRVFKGDRFSLEGVLVPRFRRGTFDALHEESSPFNLARGAVLPAGLALGAPAVVHLEPTTTLRNVSGGGRLQATIGGVDLSVMGYRGFDAFGPVAFVPAVGLLPAGSGGTSAAVGEGASQPAPAVVGSLVQHHPRFTMAAADAETVIGEWAVRGEVAWFVNRELAGSAGQGLVPARSLDAGLGVDRRAGAFRVFASWLVHREWSRTDPALARTDVTVLGSIERPFARDRLLARVFVVTNPSDRSGFARALVSWTVRDNVSLDVSAASFVGTSDDTIGRFAGRDFVFARLRVAY